MSAEQRARDFVLRNARQLERRLFAFHFDGGDAAAVVRALTAYQNPDGGFGGGLEPDKRDPASQPVDMQVALETLDAVGAVQGPMITAACDWLERTATSEGGVPYALPSLNAYPHAPWWGVKEASPPANLNPTAVITGLLLKHDVRHRWLQTAIAYCFTAIEASQSAEFHELMPVITFLEHAPDRPRAERLLAAVAERIAAPGVVALDPAAEGYVKKPLDWAPRRESYCRRLFADDVIAAHLDALAARQQDDGGWPISWDPISPGVALEWRGMTTIQALLTLRSYAVVK